MNKIFCFLLSLIALVVEAQNSFGYNQIPEFEIRSKTTPEGPRELYRSNHWFGLGNKSADLVDTKGGYYPEFLEKVYYFKNYLGLTIHDPKKKNNQTFAVTPLLHPLEKGGKYRLIIQGYFPMSMESSEREIRRRMKLHRKQEVPWKSREVKQLYDDIHSVSLGFSLSEKEPRDIQTLKNKANIQRKVCYNYFNFAFDFVATEASKYLVIGNFLSDSDIASRYKSGSKKYIIISSTQLTKITDTNLISNPQFEDFSDSPFGPGEWWRLKDWFSPHPNRKFHEHLPSPDFIHTSMGLNTVIDGSGSARVGYINMDTLAFNEALSVKLKQKTKKGSRYNLEYSLCPSNVYHQGYVWSRKKNPSDLDSLKIQFGLAKDRPMQSSKQFLTADQILTYSVPLSLSLSCENTALTFVAEESFDYLTVGYFEELDVPRFGEVGVYFDNMKIYEIPKDIDSAYFASLDKHNRKEETLVLKPPQEELAIQKPRVEVPKEQFDTNLKVKHNVEVNAGNCDLSLYDHGTEDGDIVTLVVNGEKVVEHLKIRRKPNVKTVNVELKPGDNIIYPIAENLGRIPPNTLHVSLSCNSGQGKEYKLFSKPGESEVLRLRLADE